MVISLAPFMVYGENIKDLVDKDSIYIKALSFKKITMYILVLKFPTLLLYGSQEVRCCEGM